MREGVIGKVVILIRHDFWRRRISVHGFFAPLRITILVLAFIPPAAFADDQEAKVQRDEKGVIIHEGHHLIIPEDQKMVQVSPNVIRAEDDDIYVKRKLDAFEARVEQLEARLAGVEEELSEMKAGQAARGKS